MKRVSWRPKHFPTGNPSVYNLCMTWAPQTHTPLSLRLAYHRDNFRNGVGRAPVGRSSVTWCGGWWHICISHQNAKMPGACRDISKNVLFFFFFHSRSCLHACLRQSTTLWAAEESQWLFIRKTTQLNNSLGFLEQRNVLVVLIFGEMASHSMFVIYYHQLRIKAADNYLLWATF